MQGHDAPDDVDHVVCALGRHEPVAGGQPGPAFGGVDGARSAPAVHAEESLTIVHMFDSVVV
jgi:hypothetical protein